MCGIEQRFLLAMTALFLASSFAFRATPAGKFALTIDNIMRGPGYTATSPPRTMVGRWRANLF